ncbi:exocyst complex component EXO70A1-like protein [Tanacetum coccineum]
MGFDDLTMENLRDRAATMKDCLARSQVITDSMTSILGSFDLRLSALETAMRPTQIKTHSMRRAHENIDKTLKFAHAVLVQFDLVKQAETIIMRGPHEDLESYLEAVNQLKNIVRFFSTNKNLKSSVGVITQATTLLQKSSFMLEEEFRQLLYACSKPVEPDRLFDCLPASLRPSTNQGEGAKKHPADHDKSSENAVYSPPTLIPAKLVPLLHDLAQQMFQTGQQQQRSLCIEGSLKKLGVEKLGKDDVQKMQWEVLEAKIGNWIHFVRIAVKLLFAAERKVSDQVFEGMESFMDQCFVEATASSVSLLLSFGEAIAKSKRSPEKLFVLLDMYEIMKEVEPELPQSHIKAIFFKSFQEAIGQDAQLAKVTRQEYGKSTENNLDGKSKIQRSSSKVSIIYDAKQYPTTIVRVSAKYPLDSMFS